jgi:hypothetical protein
VSIKAIALPKAILEELGDQCFVVGQGGDAVPKVARGQHPQLAAQSPRRAAVIGYGDDGRDVGRVDLEAAQKGR